MLNDEGMAACGFLEIFMTRKVPGSLLDVSREKWSWKDCEERYSPIKLLKDTFE